MKTKSEIIKKWHTKLNLLNNELAINATLSDFQPNNLINTKNLVLEFIEDLERVKLKISPYNLAHSEISDCCGCFDMIDENGILSCNECNTPLHEAIINVLNE